MRNIFGYYTDGNTVIHKTNPEMKLLVLLGVILVVALIPGIWGICISAVAAALFIKAAKLNIRYVWTNLKGLKMLFVVVFAMNFLFFYPDKAFLDFLIFTPSVEGALRGVKITWNIVIAVLMASVVTATTTPIEMTKGIEKIICPLKVIGVPTKDIATILGISLQLIPIFVEEADKIKKAQMARGASFEGGNLIEIGKAVLPLVIPIFVAAFRRADELAVAMEARCYISEKRRFKGV